MRGEWDAPRLGPLTLTLSPTTEVNDRWCGGEGTSIVASNEQLVNRKRHYVVINSLGIQVAAALDEHFRNFGNLQVVP